MIGVSQNRYGHEMRWIFSDAEVYEQVFSPLGYDGVPDDIVFDCHWPYGGSNSSATYFKKLKTDEEALAFLKAPAEADYDDPELIDLAEFYLTIETDCDSITQKVLDKFNLSADDLGQVDPRYKEIQMLIVNNSKLAAIDYSNPFYGKSKNLRYSQLL